MKVSSQVEAEGLVAGHGFQALPHSQKIGRMARPCSLFPVIQGQLDLVFDLTGLAQAVRPCEDGDVFSRSPASM